MQFFMSIIVLVLFGIVGGGANAYTVSLSYDENSYSQCRQQMSTLCYPSAGNPRASYGILETETTSTLYKGRSSSSLHIVERIACYIQMPNGPKTFTTGMSCPRAYLVSNDSFPTEPTGNSTPPEKNGPPNNQCGSVIDVNDLSLAESIHIPGIESPLVYSTNRVLGKIADYKIRIPVFRYPDQDDNDVRIRVTINGNSSVVTYTANELINDLIYEPIWDGNDQNGDPMIASTEVKVEYLDSSADQYMNEFNSALITFELPIGGWKSSSVGLGGWNFADHHYYDNLKGSLYLGNGAVKSVAGRSLYYSGNGVLRSPTSSLEQENVIFVPSEDGLEGYLFDIDSGRHLKTLSAITGEVLKTFTHDGLGRLIEIEDSFGNDIQIQHISATIVKVISPSGQITELNLNSDGWLASLETAGGKTYGMTYKDEKGLLKTFTQPSGVVSEFSYDLNGRLIKDESSAGSLWDISLILNSSGSEKEITMSSAEGLDTTYLTTVSEGGKRFVRTKTLPGGAVEKTTYYDKLNLELRYSDGSRKSLNFNEDTRLGEGVLRASGGYFATSTFSNYISHNNYYSSTHDENNILKLLTESSSYTAGGNSWEKSYNSNQSQFTYISPEGRTAKYSINDYAQVTKIENANFLPVDIIYDIKGRPINYEQGSRVTTLTYDSNDRVSSITNSLNETTQYEYSADGELIKQILADSREISYSYDSAGRLSSVTPPGRPAYGFFHNLFDLMSSYLAPVLGGITYEEIYTYNLDGKIAQWTRADGSQINYLYSSTTGLLSVVSTPTSSITYTYNPANQLTSMTGGNIIDLLWTYDSDLAVTAAINGTGFSTQLNYTYTNYDLTGLGISTPTQTSDIILAYDDDKLLLQVGDLAIVRDPNSGLVTEVNIGSLQETKVYSASFGEITSITTEDQNQTLFSEIYQRDSVGRVESKTVGNIVTSYVYDSTGRLTQVSDGNVVRSYGYDSNGNRLTKTVGSTVTSATYDDQDRLLTYGNTTYQYDLNGNRTEKSVSPSSVATYTYNSFGQLSQVVLPNKTIQYQYDGFGRRSARTEGTQTIYYLYQDALHIAAMLDDQGEIIAQFFYSGDGITPEYMVKGGVTYKLQRDYLGSVKLVIEAQTSNVVQELDYDEFGVVVTDTNPGFQPFGFAGGLYDSDTKLLRFGARDYDPETGRWTSKDPILFNGGDTNLYGYVLNDPINFVDPSGLFLSGDQVGGIIGGAIGGAWLGRGAGWPGMVGGALIGGTVGGVIGPHVGGFLNRANACPLPPPRSEAPLLPPVFYPQNNNLYM